MFDFEETYKLSSVKLIQLWPVYSEELNNILRLYKLDGSFATMWPKDVEKFLILLKLLPTIANGPKALSAGVETFNRSVDKLIVFQPVSTTIYFYIYMD